MKIQILDRVQIEIYSIPNYVKERKVREREIEAENDREKYSYSLKRLKKDLSDIDGNLMDLLKLVLV